MTTCAYALLFLLAGLVVVYVSSCAALPPLWRRWRRGRWRRLPENNIARDLVKNLQDFDWETWNQLDDAMSFEGDGMEAKFAELIVKHLREE
ncbi:MAG: hypothetical protein ACYDHY_06945 [Acidiferrobacterales bacterium]